jgi:Icc-related predicted phosphoesterase
MRIHVSSDHHIDIERNGMEPLPDTGADVIVVAGDARAPGTVALRQLRSMFEQTTAPMVYVAGNHDHYSEGDPKARLANPELHTTWERQLAEMPHVAREEGVHLIAEGSAVEIDGVRFVGGTLWSDMAARPGYMTMAEAMRAAEKMNDYRLIKVGKGRSKDVLRPRDTITAHRKTVSFITETLATPFGGEATVLVTHHAPSYRSLLAWTPERPEQFKDLDWCYASNCEHWFTGEGMPDGYVPPVVAIHGHIHANRDYFIGNTRVVCNPRGYPNFALRENPHFDPAFVIEIEPRYVPTMRI